MFHNKLLCVLSSFFYIVLQIRADPVWKGVEETRNAMYEHYLHLRGVDVSTDDIKESICQLGTQFNPPLYENIARPIQSRFIPVKLPAIKFKVNLPSSSLAGVNQPQISENVLVNALKDTSVEVIYCGSDNEEREYYFGKGPFINSIVAYMKVPNGTSADIIGMFTEFI